jgi:hypothetical protein
VIGADEDRFASSAIHERNWTIKPKRRYGSHLLFVLARHPLQCRAASAVREPAERKGCNVSAETRHRRADQKREAAGTPEHHL